jgi:excinuclease ABC subunit B
LIGATGTGKTAEMSWVFEQLQRPALVLAHNKTLVSQLYAEFRDLLPDTAVEMFISYYDSYQPEAYVPSKDLYIEKEASINEEIDRLRHAATQALLTRRDVLIVASVSCIYGLGSPLDYGQVMVPIAVGEVRNREKLLRQLLDLQFARNDIDFHRGTFRVRGDTLDIFPANAETAWRVELWGDEVERISEFDPLTGEVLEGFEAGAFASVGDSVTEEALTAAQRIVSDAKAMLSPSRYQSLAWVYFAARKAVLGKDAPAQYQQLRAI